MLDVGSSGGRLRVTPVSLTRKTDSPLRHPTIIVMLRAAPETLAHLEGVGNFYLDGVTVVCQSSGDGEERDERSIKAPLSRCVEVRFWSCIPASQMRPRS
jgi:hypothetical protein